MLEHLGRAAARTLSRIADDVTLTHGERVILLRPTADSRKMNSTTLTNASRKTGNCR